MNYLPKISVIIPTYNNATFLRESIDSVALQQYDNLELIIVDDGSSDNTQQVIESCNVPLFYYQCEHLGASAARNFGVQKATGEYLAFLDADDLWPREKLNKQLACLLSSEFEAVFTGLSQFIDPSAAQLKLKKEDTKITPGVCASTLLMRHEKFLEVGYFKTFALGEFIEWFMRAKLHYEVLYDLVTLRRIHENNTSLHHKFNKKEYLSALYEGLKNKRKIYDSDSKSNPTT